MRYLFVNDLNLGLKMYIIPRVIKSSKLSTVQNNGKKVIIIHKIKASNNQHIIERFHLISLCIT